MAVLSNDDEARALSVLGAHRFEQRLDAVKAYCGNGFLTQTFLDVLDQLDRGDLSLHFRTDGSFEVRPGRRGMTDRVKSKTGAARRG